MHSVFKTLKSNDTYQRMHQLDDWQSYFDTIKAQLQNRAKQLEKEYQTLLDPKNQTDEETTHKSKSVIAEDAFWESEF